MFDTVQHIKHPLVQHKLTLMRDKRTDTQLFRNLVTEVAMLMGYEVLKDLPMHDVNIETPLEQMTAQKLSGEALCIVPILRAGQGFLEGILQLVPDAAVGHMGLYRDPETLQAVEYYCKMPPDLSARTIVVVDPMLATGHTAIAALDKLKERGARHIKFMCLLAAPEGLEAVVSRHSDVPIYTAAIDRELNDHGYILPGLGDAGDRIFGTK